MSVINQSSLSLLLLIFFITTGCAPNAIYRSAYQSCIVADENSCDLNAIQMHRSGTDQAFLLSFVEVDDQGQLRDRRQMYAVLDYLYEIASSNNLLINVFVHGWHHNAKPNDSNIAGFKKNLARLSQIEQRLSQDQGRLPRKVVGIYVGWQGESIDFPALRYLTFWDRKNTAENVGLMGISELLLKLEQVSHVKNAQQPDAKSRLVVFGHSFGGAVVYNAAAQILASRFINSEIGKSFEGPVEGFGDLVVLLNPAIEAIKFAPLYDLSQSRCSYPFSKRPRLAILTSETDYATKYAFWIGRVFSTFAETHNVIEREECKGQRKLIMDEGEADRNTIGHFPPLITHQLIKATEPYDASFVTERLISLWQRQSDEGAPLRFGNTELVHLQKTAPFNPYLNIEVSQELMDGHNDIFGDDLMEFIRMLIVLSTNQ